MAALTGVGYAQLTPLPPASSTEGVAVQHIGSNGGATHWDSTSSLGAFKSFSLTDGAANIGTNSLGLNFNASQPSAVQTNLSTVLSSGGTVRAVFLSESAMWRDSFGYSRDGNAAGTQSYTVFAAAEANPTSATDNVVFGDYVDVNFAAGANKAFDFWLSAPGFGDSNGGVFTMFDPSKSSSYTAPGNVFWAQNSIAANTYVPSTGAYADVQTYLVSFEDWRLDRGSDRDYSDFVVGLQFFSPTGTPLTPVPEPSTYSLIGASALLGLALFRRYRRKNSAPAKEALPA